MDINLQFIQPSDKTLFFLANRFDLTKLKLFLRRIDNFRIYSCFSHNSYGDDSGGISAAAKSDIYAFFFDQKGLMAGIGLQGTKITKIDKY